jgi:hypothetical protein
MIVKLPNTAIDEVSSMVDNLLASAVFHCDFHKLLEDRIVAVVPIPVFVEVRLDVGWHFGHMNQ